MDEKRLLVELQALRGAQKEKRMEVEWCTNEQQLADALTKSMVAWRLINVMRTANINAMYEKNDQYAKQVTPKPRTKQVKDWVMVSIRGVS